MEGGPATGPVTAKTPASARRVMSVAAKPAYMNSSPMTRRGATLAALALVGSTRQSLAAGATRPFLMGFTP
jgi:hypothetical protein